MLNLLKEISGELLIAMLGGVVIAIINFFVNHIRNKMLEKNIQYRDII